jgi:hypothetical protein
VSYSTLCRGRERIAKQRFVRAGSGGIWRDVSSAGDGRIIPNISGMTTTITSITMREIARVINGWPDKDGRVEGAPRRW